MTQQVQEVQIGSIRAVKNLYNHSTSRSRSSAKWSEIKDSILEERRIKELGQSHFIVRRYSKQKTDDDDYTWTISAIEIKSPTLQSFLDKIFHDYPNPYADDSPYTFFPPYNPLVHRWEAIQHAVKAEGNNDLREELHMFHEEIEPLLTNHISALAEVKRTSLLTFDQLWLVLAPGEFAVSNIGGNTCLFKIVAAKRYNFGDDDYDGDKLDNEKPYWILTIGQIDWNGSQHGFTIGSTKLRYFEGSKLIQKLNYYPFEFTPDHANLREKLLQRGRKFESLRGFHVTNVHGKKFVPTPCGLSVEPIAGRFVVDAHAYYFCQSEVAPKLIDSILEAPGQKNEDDNEDDDEDLCDEDLYDGKEDEDSGKITPAEIEASNDQSQRNEDLKPLTDDECLLAVPRVKGFDLQGKEWCLVNVDDIRDPEWNDHPYDNLVLKEEQKTLLMAFADNQVRNTGFDDFVKHKVAEKSRVPLYMLSAGELGSKPNDLEAGLKRALTCCQLWGAVLLIDEADVFMESRSSNNLIRNELVSIFLRQLEYYQGLLFLTTNRLSTIDPAFRSRVDLILPYHDLDEAARKQVWKNFIRRLPANDVQMNDSDFDELAKTAMNGREIKNLIKTALVLGARDKPLKMNHFNVVLGIRKEVDQLEFGGRD
ncbi:uncharacterized protein N0V89_006137 [Didymosphaeria variabile]|uniref:P-loop containing nucleoside triphosphate hydrolase protein n=1 Tax=Didymosphaeria variabile TaxID=1932322 RepID=A0A9W8XMN4_9PLEO|nr:uncharacterized protein N0V89_006137 [Didymosphaeria variabile]KAJ4354401.1 hypothetical protein N0V89_006137 [Didymosphaeria variabile]